LNDGILGAFPSAEVFLSRLGISFFLKQCFSLVNSLQKHPQEQVREQTTEELASYRGGKQDPPGYLLQ